MSRRTYVKSVRAKSSSTARRARAAQAYLRSRRSFAAAGQLSRLSRAGPAAFVTPTLMRQIKSVVKAKHRDAADITRAYTFTGAAEYTDCVLTCSHPLGAAPSGTGLLDCDADEVLINSIRIKGEFFQPCVQDLVPLANYDTRVRRLVVWYNKPLTVASAAGNIPPVTEVLTIAQVDSLPIGSASNGGRFVILSDRTWMLGENSYWADVGPPNQVSYRNTGRNRIPVDYTVKVNRMCKFLSPSSSGTQKGGHYDLDVPAGQVASGLLVMYTICSQNLPQNLEDYTVTRLNYTG